MVKKSGYQPTVYVLHGWAIDPQNQDKWQPLLDALAKFNIFTKFLFLPGLSQPLDQVWTLTDYVNWLAEQLKDQQEVILLGHSFGGQLAIRYATTHPQQVKKLILIANSGLRDWSVKARIKRSLFYVLAKLGKLLVGGVFFRRLIYKLARETDYLKANPVQRQTMINVLEDEIRADLSKVSCPTLIIWGQNDQTTPLKNAQLVKKQINNSQLKVISEARHSPQFTDANAVAKLIKEFV
ncbi:MAG: alpha/beta fold hydrolase [Candidatus Pacebacteria bacterium]|nr:alpha/beta fold hydrolase [Candidatus Paceibacterota bacterium]